MPCHDLKADDLTIAPVAVEPAPKIRQCHALKADDAAFDVGLIMDRVAVEFAPKKED